MGGDIRLRPNEINLKFVFFISFVVILHKNYFIGLSVIAAGAITILWVDVLGLMGYSGY